MIIKKTSIIMILTVTRIQIELNFAKILISRKKAVVTIRANVNINMLINECYN